LDLATASNSSSSSSSGELKQQQLQLGDDISSAGHEEHGLHAAAAHEQTQTHVLSQTLSPGSANPSLTAFMHVHGSSTAYAGDGAVSDAADDSDAGADDDEAALLAHLDGADEEIGRLMRELTPVQASPELVGAPVAFQGRGERGPRASTPALAATSLRSGGGEACAGRAVDFLPIHAGSRTHHHLFLDRHKFLDPTGYYVGSDCTDGWFINATVGALFGNGKAVCGDNGAGGYKQGDRVGVLLDLDNGSLRFFKNGVEHGPGYAAGSVTGPVVHAVQIYNKGTSVRLLPDAQAPAGNK
jgi:hypothetical protein